MSKHKKWTWKEWCWDEKVRVSSTAKEIFNANEPYIKHLEKEIESYKKCQRHEYEKREYLESRIAELEERQIPNEQVIAHQGKMITKLKEVVDESLIRIDHTEQCLRENDKEAMDYFFHKGGNYQFIKKAVKVLKEVFGE